MARLRKDKLGFHFVIPSRGRAGEVISPENLGLPSGSYSIVVNSREEKREYARHNDCQIIVSEVKGITANRNFILDYYGEGERIITLCDDITGFFGLPSDGGKTERLPWKELRTICEMGFDGIARHETALWGVYPINNHFFMSHTLSPNNFIIGTFSGIYITDIRHDPKLVLKEDYDFTIKHILRYKKVLRYNMYAVEAKHYKNKGGCVDYRTAENEQKSISRLVELYPNFVRLNPKRENEIILKFRKAKKKC